MEGSNLPDNTSIYDTLSSSLEKSPIKAQQEYTCTTEDTNEVVHKIQQMSSIQYNSPLPPPEVLDGYERHIPGFAMKLFDYLEKEQSARHKVSEEASQRENRKLEILEKTTLSAINQAQYKIYIGLFLSILCMIVSIVSFVYGITVAGVSAMLAPAIYYIAYVLSSIFKK